MFSSFNIYLIMAFAAGYLFHANVEVIALGEVMMVAGIIGIIHYFLGDFLERVPYTQDSDTELVKVSDDPKKYPQYKIVAVSEEIVGKHNGKPIHKYLVMENEDVYEYKKTAGTDEPHLEKDELLLESGLIYFKPKKTMIDIQKELIEQRLAEYGIDTNDIGSIEDLQATLKSILEEDADLYYEEDDGFYDEDDEYESIENKDKDRKDHD